MQTPLHGWHAAHGGRLIDFSGWSMPVQYASIVVEHNATRNAVGLFDVSHMGRLRFSGPDAAAFLDYLVTRRVADMPVGKIRYALIANENGGILDDVLVYHLSDLSAETYFSLVVNAGNREKIKNWITAQLAQPGNVFDVSFRDETLETAMIAVQGPRAVELVDSLIDVSVVDLAYYTGVWTEILGAPCVISRTGYTGEDGCEITVPSAAGENVWATLLEAGEPLGAVAAGLGARDTLRLESAMPLYGHELNENIGAYQAGLGFAVNLKGRDFIGRESLEQLKGKTDTPKRVGLVMAGRRIPREHFAVVHDGAPVGEVTSGTFSPTFQKPIAMAYTPPDLAHEGVELSVQIRDRLETAHVVKLPFYKRGEKGQL